LPQFKKISGIRQGPEKNASKSCVLGKKRVIQGRSGSFSGMKRVARDLQNLQTDAIEGKNCYNLEIIQ